MPAYRFEALQHDGTSRTGVLEADSLKAARQQLRQQSLVPLTVEAIARPSADADLPWWQRPLGRGRVFNSRQRAIFTRQLAGLVGSGLPLERALAALADEAEQEPQRLLLADIRAEVNGGSPLGKALALHPQDFPAIDRAVISAGNRGANWAPCSSSWPTTSKNSSSCAPV